MFITTKELAAQGLRPHEIATGVAAGMLVQVRRGVYRARESESASAPEEDLTTRQRDHLLQVEATMPLLRPGACLSHVSAGLVHGLPIPDALLGPVAITRSGGSGKITRSLHLHRCELPPEEIVDGRFGPMTSLARTVLDLARTLAPVHAVAVVDRALRLGADRGAILGLLDAHRARGNVQARSVVRFGDAASESVGESHSRWLMHELGIPAPRLQVSLFADDGGFVARPDFLWEDCRVIGEFDGRVKYGRLLTPGQQLADVVLAEKQREEALRRLGYWVIRWTWADLDDRDGFQTLITRGRQLGLRARA